jgi:hypothetical protein
MYTRSTSLALDLVGCTTPHALPKTVMGRSGSPVSETIECDVFTFVTPATREDGGYVARLI